MNILIFGLIGGLSSFIVNKKIAVFNDGLRAIIMQYVENKVSKEHLKISSLALCLSLIFSFGLPFSIGFSIVLIHSLLLMSDIIGTWMNDGKSGAILSFILGFIYACLLLKGLEFIVFIFGNLPINFSGSLNKIRIPLTMSFSFFPILAISSQHGFKKGIFSFFLSFVIIFLGKKLNLEKTVISSLILICGMFFLFMFSLKNNLQSDSNQKLISIFSKNLLKIKKNSYILGILGGLLAVATSMKMVSGDPMSLNLLLNDEASSAFIVALIRGLALLPLVFSTSIVTGVYGTAGSTLVFSIGILFLNNPIFAFIFGFIIIFLEISLLNNIALGLDKFPSFREVCEHIRTSLNKILEISILFGSAMAADDIYQGFGYFWVFGFYFLNKNSKKPLIEVAVGPIAVLVLGLIANVLFFLK